MADEVPADQQGYPGYQTPWSDKSAYNATRFIAEQVMSRISTATLVKIQKVTTKGEVGPVGQVDVVPLVNTQDGLGNNFKHGAVHSMPYFRYQGGSDKAIIMDPKVGDIGLAIFADRDISGVKRKKDQAPPGSFRRFDMADGLFLGCFLGEKPKCYIQFTDDNKIVSSPDEGKTVMTLEKDKVTIKMSDDTKIRMIPGRIDLGDIDGSAVMTEGGPSSKVFAVV